jgi:hypothetical protein
VIEVSRNEKAIQKDILPNYEFVTSRIFSRPYSKSLKALDGSIRLFDLIDGTNLNVVKVQLFLGLVEEAI